LTGIPASRQTALHKQLAAGTTGKSISRSTNEKAYQSISPIYMPENESFAGRKIELK